MGGGHTVHWLGTGHIGARGPHCPLARHRAHVGGGHTVHWLGTGHMGGGEFRVRDSEAVLYATSHTLF